MPVVGLVPPAWLRMLWRRGEHREIYELQLSLITAESQEMFTALKEDRLSEYVIANPDVVAKEK